MKGVCGMVEDIKMRLESIKLSSSIEEKLLLAMDLLVNTDVVKSENALCQFDNEEWYQEQNYLKKYLAYKFDKEAIYNGVDCDVSLLCIVMYVLLSSNIELTDIVDQSESGDGKKYEIRINENRFKGDTLTSPLHLLKLYLGSLWKHIDNNDQLKSEKRYKDFYDLFPDGTANNGKILFPVKNRKEIPACFYKHSDVIWDAMDDEIKCFLRNYYMFGNYMRVPGNSYPVNENRSTSFNMSRSDFGKRDTVDTLLVKIYAYYKYDDSSYLKSMFTMKQEELTQETLSWLGEFDGWTDFVDKNALSAFVDEQTMAPICLKTGCPVKENELNSYDAIPKNYEEFLAFFDELSERIALRSESIGEKLSSMKTSGK